MTSTEDLKAEETGTGATSVTNELVFYPPNLWGLDYHFNTFNKLYVADILSLQSYPSYPGEYFDLDCCGKFKMHQHRVYKNNNCVFVCVFFRCLCLQESPNL
jgi:hypothetical protein